MSLLDTASLIVTPNGYKEGKLYSVIPSDGSGDMSVVRATTATRVNSSGLVELVPYNLLSYSEQFDNAAWTKLRATISANTTTAPDGTLTADKIVENTDNNSHAILQAATNTSGQQYTVTVYAKADERNWFVIYTGGGPAQGRFFDLSNGTLGSVLANTPNASSITDAGNGWYRCSITYTATDASTDITFLTAISDGNNVYTGDGTSGIYLWGAQANEGSTALPYQKTETRLNIPRLDYSNGTCPSLLVEPQRTNTLVNSVLSGTGSTPTSWLASFATGSSFPTASILTDIGQAYTFTTANQRQIIYQNQSLVSGSSYSLSVYVESVTGSIPVSEVLAFTGTGTTTYYKENSVINLTDLVESGYRYTVVRVAGATAAVQARIGNGCGTTTTGSVVLSMPQHELGSYPTSYIPTTSASVTRNADVISKTGISSLIGQTEGTVFVDLENYIELDMPCFTIDNGTNDNRIVLYRENGTGYLGLFLAASGTPVSAISTTSASNGQIAIAYTGTTFVMYRNGVQILSTTSAIPSSMSAVRFNGRATNDFYTTRKIKSFALWQTRLTNDELATLTTL